MLNEIAEKIVRSSYGNNQEITFLVDEVKKELKEKCLDLNSLSKRELKLIAEKIWFEYVEKENKRVLNAFNNGKPSDTIITVRQRFYSITSNFMNSNSKFSYLRPTNKYNVKEVVSDVMEKFWKFSHKDKVIPTYYPKYAYGIIRNTAFDYLKKKIKNSKVEYVPPVKDEDYPNNVLDNMEDKKEEPMFDDELIMAAKNFIDHEMKEPYKETLILYYIRGFTVKEIAEEMDAGESNVKQRLAKGRKLILQKLKQL